METWKDIPGFEGRYEVSDLGRIKSPSKTWIAFKNFIRSERERVLKTHLDKDGYEIVRLCDNGVRKRFKVHRLVAKAFIPNIYNKPQVNHKNGIKTDNYVENLEWVTTQENVQHSFDTGLKEGLKGHKHPNSRLVLNTETGIYYHSVPEAAFSVSDRIKTSNLYNQLSGYSKNKTYLVYV